MWRGFKMRAYYNKQDDLIVLSDSENYTINRRNDGVLTNRSCIRLIKELKEALTQKHIVNLVEMEIGYTPSQVKLLNATVGNYIKD